MTLFLGLVIGATLGITISLASNRRANRFREERARVAERRAADAERLAELGSLTSGLAHEIKNPLSTVILNAQLVEEAIRDLEASEDETAPILRRVDALVREADRLRTILTDFLRFAGRFQLDLEPTDLIREVEDVLDFFHPQVNAAEVVLRPDLPPGPLMIPIDAALFKQALLNLLINAVHAMEQNPTGHPRELLVRVLVESENAEVHVIDSGPGVPEEIRERIFHPYVSGTPGGSGLGLPTARRIIEEHGGRIGLDVLAGRGSDFTIILPRSAAADEATPSEGDGLSQSSPSP
ncbi:MAG: ATP-binding protein [Planctomycetota bacterium]|jgi:signal transduction histidine kinase|nr:ATP-binding protein [Planctomycetota bacterium]MDA1024876.1 ATP-binding protein [Planctomycetota bacterium]